MTRISVFVDCDSESLVMRVPYELAADLIANCPPSDDLKELREWLLRASARSKKLRASLKDKGVEAE